MKDDFVLLRPHHALCMYLYTGRGYNNAFCANMQMVQNKIFSGSKIYLKGEKDDICECCPKFSGKSCEDENKTSIYDRRFLQFCMLEEESYISWEVLCSLLQCKILDPGKRRSVCGSCGWSAICDRRERKLLCQ